MKQYRRSIDEREAALPGGGVIQALARGILEAGVAEGVFGYSGGYGDDDARPVFLTEVKGTVGLTVSGGAPYGLARLVRDYLRDRRVAIFGRTCDIRAVAELVKRNSLDPDRVITVGINCDTVPGGSARSSCRRCEYPRAVMADLEISVGGRACAVEVHSERGEAVLQAAGLAEAPPFALPGGWEEMAAAARAGEFALREAGREERLAYWFSQFDKCIKCYGCRNACPLCYCKDCYLDAGRGLVPGGQLAPARLFHLTRLAHVADSCLNCGQCEAACPMEIPLTRLYHMLHKELSAIFGYRPGIDPTPPPLIIFDESEKARAESAFTPGR
ncbi:MAG: 4Fe-4S dicluster domain-containing protein [Bacillota bacterium]|nr:4Fe-4S dicluster domain-containing protein [Bacillota bacterium]